MPMKRLPFSRLMLARPTLVVGLSEPRARGDELRRSQPQQLDELQISGRAGKVE